MYVLYMFVVLFYETDKVEHIQICQYMIYLLGSMFHYVTNPDIVKCVYTFFIIHRSHISDTFVLL